MRNYLIEFNKNLGLRTCKINGNTPKDALTRCMKQYRYPCNIINTDNKELATARVTLINGKKKVINYYSICYTGYNKYMSLGLRSGIGRKLTNKEIEIVKREATLINIDINKLVFNDTIHIRTCYMAKEDIIYIGSDIFPDITSASTNPIDLLSVRAVLAHEYYGHRPRRQQYLDEDNHRIQRMDYWEDEYLANYNAAKNTPNISDMDRYRLVQSAIRRCEEAGVYLEKDSFIMEVLYGTGYN